MRNLLILAVLAWGCGAQVRIPGPGGATSSGGGGGGGGGSVTCTPVSGYAYCRVLTVDRNQVGGSTLNSFAVAAVATLGASRIRNANCYDVVFTSDSGGTAMVPWELESCAQGTGAIVAWVLASSLSSSTNTQFFVSYDNAAISTAQNSGGLAPLHVWDSNYAGVWHLPNGATLSGSDSTSNGYTLSNYGATAATGQIDGGAAFSAASSAYMENASFAEGGDGFNLTVSFWINSATLTSQVSSLVYKANGTNNWEVVADTTNFVWYTGNNSGTFTAPGNSAWHYVIVSMISGTAYCYVDGALESTLTGMGTAHNAAALMVGGVGAYYISASMDELRISNIGRAAAWITTEYNNQKPGSTFLTVGSEL
jgi:hypothetical protein